MKNRISNTVLLCIIFSIGIFLISCEKDAHVPPDVSFKTGPTYISASQTTKKDTTLLVGIIAKKTEDVLKILNVSYAYNGTDSTKTFQNIQLDKSEEGGFEKDVTIQTRNLAGNEKWIFTVSDRDGNITHIDFTLTVQ